LFINLDFVWKWQTYSLLLELFPLLFISPLLSVFFFPLHYSNAAPNVEKQPENPQICGKEDWPQILLYIRGYKVKGFRTSGGL